MVKTWKYGKGGTMIDLFLDVLVDVVFSTEFKIIMTCIGVIAVYTLIKLHNDKWEDS